MLDEEKLLVENFGTHLHEMRTTMKISLRQLAKMAGVDKMTIMRIEKGLHCPSRRVREALGHALTISPDIMTKPRVSVQTCSVRRAADCWWHVNEAKPDVPIDESRIQGERERQRLCHLGFVSGFQLLSNAPSVGAGITQICLLEIWRRRETPSSHQGFEICHVLRGEVRLYVGDETHELYEGDGAIFVSSLPQDYEPLHPLGPNDQPCLLVMCKALPRS